MTTTTRDDDVRNQVARHYAAALQKGCCGAEAQAGSLGYAPGDLADVPEGVEAPSFGCGNPVAFTGIQEGQVVLDLGSGAGLDLILAARKVGPSGRVIGVDMTPEMIARARQNVAAAGLGNVEIRAGVIEKLPVDDGSVDWVISNCVINLSPDKPAVFREIARVLRPGGRMLVSDIVAEGLPSWVLESAALYASCVAGAVPEADYVRMLGEAGLEEARVIERVPYGAESIASIAGEVLSGSCCGGSAKGLASQAAATLAGRIASIRVSARKPV